MTRYPTLTSLKAFEALVRRGKIRSAAEELHVTPGAVSQQIRALEQHFGRALFDRNSRSMKPTAEAHKLATELAVGFEHIHTAVDRYDRTARKEQLRIATLPSVAARIVLPKLHEFRALCPDVQLSFSYVHRLEDVDHWDADVLICAVDGVYTGTGTASKMFDGSVQPFASSSFVNRFGPFESPADIAEATLLHDFSTRAWQSWFEDSEICTSDTIAGDVFEDFELLIHAALADQGIALCPPVLIGRELGEGRLVPVTNQCTSEDRGYYVVLPVTAKPIAFEFADWLERLTREIS